MEDNKLNTIIHRSRINELVILQKGSSFITYAGTVILFFIFNHHNNMYTKLWMGGNTILLLMRLAHIKYYELKIKDTLPSFQKLREFETYYAILLFFIGILWGLSIHIYIESATKETLMLLVVFPIGAIVGGSLKLLLSPRSTVAYAGGVLATFAAYFFTHISFPALGIIFGGVVLLYSFSISSKKYYKKFFEIKRTISEKENLLAMVQEKLLLEIELKQQKHIVAQKSNLVTLGEMAGGVAHEINNPLTIIKLNLDILKKSIVEEKPLKDKGLGMLNTSLSTVQRISKVIESLLLFSREEDVSNKEFCNIDEIVNEALILFTEKYKLKNIQVRVDMMENILVNINKVSMIQVIINLLNNSYYFIKDSKNAWVDITLAINNANSISLIITDSGEPIAKDIHNKIFEPFFTSKPIGDGAGLGLSMSKGVVESNSGILSLRSGDHPCFVITLPVAKDESKLSA